MPGGYCEGQPGIDIHYEGIRNMKNTVRISTAIDAVYALSSLKTIIKNPALPGPIGREEQPALEALARSVFREVCADLGLTPGEDDSVELPGDHHELLQAIVTDRTIAALSDREARPELFRRLRRRLKRRPEKAIHSYF